MKVFYKKSPSSYRKSEAPLNAIYLSGCLIYDTSVSKSGKNNGNGHCKTYNKGSR